MNSFLKIINFNNYGLRKVKWLLLIPLIAILFNQCKREELSTNEEKLIPFNFRLYSVEEPSALSSLTSEEGAIRQIQILVFINGKFSYKANGHNLVSASGSTSFTSYLTSTTNSIDICFLANCDNILQNISIQIGDTKSTVATKIVSAISSAGITSNFPMFGIYSSATGLSTSNPNAIPAISMLRHIARIDVDASAVSNFVLSSIQAYHVSSVGQIIPSSFTSASPVSSPSVPVSATPTISTSALSVVSGNISSSQLYLPESAAPAVSDQVTKGTCVIIGGYYNGSSSLTYYRLDFNPGISGHPFGQILRNRIYHFTITAINTVGYDTPEEAANNLAATINTQVREWDMNTMSRYIDGNYYMNLSSRSLSIGKQVGSSGTIQVSTNVPYTIQWADASGNASGTAGASLNDGTMSIAITTSGIQATALTTNTNLAGITRYVLVQGRRISALVTIKQTLFSVSSTSLTLSASGLPGYVLVSSSSTWNFISDQSWLSPTKVTGSGGVDTLKWTTQTNSLITTRSGNLSVINLDGEIATIPYTQKGQNTTILNIMSWHTDGGTLGAGLDVSTASGYNRGIKYLMVNTTNYSSTGTLNIGGFNFVTTVTNPITVSSIGSTTNVLWLAAGGFDRASDDAIISWLNADSKRVLVFIYDLYNNTGLLTKLGVTNNNVELGTIGGYPLQFTNATSYFTTTGPFTSYPYTPITSGFSFRYKDGSHGEIQLSGNENITPILLGPTGTGMTLGIDKTRRIVYVGDVDIFNSDAGSGATNDNYLMSTTGTVSNNASRLMANVWAWIVLTAQGQSPS